MPEMPKHSVSVAGIVVNSDQEVLVIQRHDNQHWEPPGGVLELNETPQDGARREVREETGLDVDVVGLSGVYKNMKRGIVSLVFLCQPIAGRRAVSDESIAVRWMNLEEVVKVMDPAYYVRVRDAFDSNCAVRSHDGYDLIEAIGES